MLTGMNFEYCIFSMDDYWHYGHGFVSKLSNEPSLVNFLCNSNEWVMFRHGTAPPLWNDTKEV